MEYKKQKYGTYNLTTVKTDKFKLCHIEVIFHNNVNVNDITKRNILFDLLNETSKNYETKRKLNLKLEDLYNARVYAVNSKVGNAFVSNFCIDFLSPEYSDKNIVKDAIDLLFEMIFNPNVNNKEFNTKEVELAKKRVKDEINGVKENPRKLSVLECLKTLNETPLSYSNIGTLEELETITPESLYNYYEEVLKNDYIDIYVVGNLDMDFVSNYIDKKSKFNVIKEHEFKMYIPEVKRKLITNSKKNDTVQTNMVVLLNLYGLSTYEKNYVAVLYNYILGGGSLQSKLYRKLRGENSLCYRVGSNYMKYNNLIMIDTGIDHNAKDKCIKLIKDSIKEMSVNITDEEFLEAQKMIETSLNMCKDFPGKIVDNEFYEDLGLIDNPDERMKVFKNVTKEDIYALSKKISLCNIYALEGKDE